VSDFFFQYIKPQETGNRGDVRWVTLASGTTYVGRLGLGGGRSVSAESNGAG
jgi:hypothetical protein